MYESAPRRRRLILLRHGESTANAEDIFGGWLDYALTDSGKHQAAEAGRLLATSGLIPDVVHTSRLSRAIDTARILIRSSGAQPSIAETWRLNERHYGLLQGRSRASVKAEFGQEQFSSWRRSYDALPPGLDRQSPSHPRYDPRYRTLPPLELPCSEALADVRRRVVPYWQDVLAAHLLDHRTTLVVAHNNSLRALCMHLDDLTPDEVQSVDIPTGVPLLYLLDTSLRPLERGGKYVQAGIPAADSRRLPR
ncbi:MAG: 2,3-bisphosphoglycerate-dependent phosphoglycerate mutase [Mycobacterium sp.]